ncbi:MAG: hypothetical protein ABI633_03495 [Burkholderiales bacterium]
MALFARVVRDRLAWAAAASVVLPWLAGEAVKRGIESGMPMDLARRIMLIDYLVAGTIFAALSLVLTVAVGCWVTAVMKGPRHTADSFPVDSPRRGP